MDWMTELFVILISTVLVNNFVLVRFLGLCPFLGVSRNLEAAMGMSLGDRVRPDTLIGHSLPVARVRACTAGP